jgi:hypothetical protein
MSKEAISKSPSGRVKRTPVGVRNVLTVKGKDPNYEYRIVNDTGDRVAQFLDAGYEVVNAADVQIGDRRVNQSSGEGSVAQTAVGGGLKGVVVRIKKEWFDEDQAAKQAQIDATEAATQHEALNDRYGKFDVSATRGTQS